MTCCSSSSSTQIPSSMEKELMEALPRLLSRLTKRVLVSRALPNKLLWEHNPPSHTVSFCCFIMCWLNGHHSCILCVRALHACVCLWAVHAVCVCVCVYVCASVAEYVCVQALLVCVCMCVHGCSRTLCVHVHVLCVCMYAYIYQLLYKHVHVCLHVYACRLLHTVKCTVKYNTTLLPSVITIALQCFVMPSTLITQSHQSI